MATAAPPRSDKQAAPSASMPAILLDFPERVERLTAPDIYAQHWIEVVTNLPPSRTTNQPIGEFMATAIKAWSFQTQDGKPAPITAEVMNSLPPDLWDWLVTEVVERRARPLTKRADNSPPLTA